MSIQSLPSQLHQAPPQQQQQQQQQHHQAGHSEERTSTAEQTAVNPNPKPNTTTWKERWACGRTCAKALFESCLLKPWILAVPLVLLVLLILAGELSVTWAARMFSSQRHDLALGVASSTAKELALQLQDMLGPAIAVAAACKANPYVPTLAQQFPSIVQGVLGKLDIRATVTRIHLGAWGKNAGIYPYEANKALVDYNFLEDKERADVWATIAAGGPDFTDLIGPIVLLDNTTGLVCRTAVFIPNAAANETFGNDLTFTVPYAPGVLLGNTTRPELTACGSACGPVYVNGVVHRFWGFIYVTLRSTGLEARLSSLEKQSVPYKYVVGRRVDGALNSTTLQSALWSAMATNTVVFASPLSLGPLITETDNPECSDLSVDAVGITWSVCVVPLDGWGPSWLLPIQIIIPFAALVVSGLLFSVLVNQQRYQALVRMMLPKKFIPYLNSGRTYVEPFKQVTILFSDIVSYTNMSSEMSPIELVHLLNEMYSAFDKLTDKHGLFKVETIGDAFMAVGGAPEPCHPRDAATRVARMALDMVDFARNYKRAVGRSVQIRVGLFTGDVKAAVIGLKMPHWCLVGDAVNTASRMESNSLPMTVHLGHTTASLLANNPEFTLQPRGTINVKGKGRMSTFFLGSAGDNDFQSTINLLLSSITNEDASAHPSFMPHQLPHLDRASESSSPDPSLIRALQPPGEGSAGPSRFSSEAVLPRPPDADTAAARSVSIPRTRTSSEKDKGAVDLKLDLDL